MARGSMNDKAKKSPARPMGSVGATMIDEARAAGVQARVAGKRREECPIFSDYPVKGCREAWLAGFDAGAPANPNAWPVAGAAPRVSVQEPAVSARIVEIQTRGGGVSAGGRRWPTGAPLPDYYERPVEHPCRKCFALTLPSGAQAVILKATKESVVYLWCRACGFQFPMPTRARS